MYDTGRLLPIFTSILGEARQYSKNEFYFYCPFCHHHKPKLAVNLGKGKWHCWTCNSAGQRLLSLLRRLDVSKNQINELRDVLADEIRYVKADVVDINLSLPNEFIPLWNESKKIEYKHAINYLFNRSVKIDDIISHNIGFCIDGPYANRIIIPSYDELGKLNYFVGRDFFETSSLKYKNPPVSKNVIGFENHINWNYPIILCEGVMDAIAIKWNSIPLFGKTLPRALQKKIVEKHVKEVYVALDEDAFRETIKLIQTFMKDGQSVYFVELHGKDPSEIGFVGMQVAIQHAKQMNFRDVISMKLS